MRSNVVLACILVAACKIGAAQDTLTRNGTDGWPLEWRFAPGDDSTWSTSGFDDSSWELRDETVWDPGIVDTMNWRGIGWYRASLVVDSSSARMPLAYAVSLVGAAELYVDGVLVDAIGRPSAGISGERALRRDEKNPAIGLLPPLSAGSHVLAMRVSNLSFSREGETRFGFDLSVGKPLSVAAIAANHHQMLTAKAYLLTGIAAALALIYLLLFTFQIKQTNNLYFGLLAALVGFVIFADLHSRTVTSLSAYLDWRRYMELAAILGWIAAVRLVRISFFKESWRLFYPLLVLAGLVALHVYFDPIGGFWSLTVFSVLAIIELLRRVGLAVFLSRPGSMTVAVGSALFVLGALHDYVCHLGWIDPVFGLSDLIHYGMIAFVVLFALFLGVDFARANRSLEHRVAQVKQEADKAILDEKANQKLRIDRIQAEFDKRRKEFEESKSRDVDDIRKSLTVAREHLKETQGRLVRVEASAALGKLVSGIAHDANEMLTGLLNQTELSQELVAELETSLSSGLNKQQAEDVLKQLRKNLDRIDEQGVAVRGIMEDILRHDADATTEVESVDVNALIDRYLKLTVHGAKGEFPGLELAVERVFDHRAGTVEANPVRLGRALMGILRNAIESLAAYSAEAGEDFQPTLTVSTQRLDHAVLVRIRDNGPGVPQDLRDRIFEPFFSTSSDKPGLGLAIAQQAIVDELDGTFGLEHFKEQGAGFYVTIPFNKESAAEAGQPVSK